MNWLFSQALVEAFSADTCSDGAPSALSSGTPTPRAFCAPDKMTDFSRPSRFGMTFGPLTDDRGAELLTWFLAGFRARTLALPEKATASMANDPDCGRKWRGSLARYDHDSRSWKTAQHSLLGDSDEFSETWPRWGTTRGGELYLLPMPALRTEGSESGLWPTPRAQEAKHGAATQWELNTDHAGTRDSLRVQVVKRMWPTPIANDAQKRGNFDPIRSYGLAGAVKLWPTPNASDNRDRGNMSDPAIQRRIEKGKQIGLSMAVKDGTQAGSLNPTWVEWLMNWPMGWTSLEPLDEHEAEYWKEASTAPVSHSGGRPLRPVWWEHDPSETPQGPRSEQQQPRKHRLALRELPCGGTHDSSAGQLRNLRRDVPAEANQTQHALRKSGVPHRKGPAVGRVAVGVIARVDRLTAIGNGQCPQAAALAWRCLTEAAA